VNFMLILRLISFKSRKQVKIMHQKLTFLTLLCLFCGSFLTAQTRVQDIESWNSAFISKEFSPRWSMTANPQFRADHNLNTMKSCILSLAVNYKINHWHVLSPSARITLRPQRVWTARFFVDNMFRKWIGKSDFQWNLRIRLQAERNINSNTPWVYTARFRPHLLWKPQRKKWEFMLLSFEAYFSNTFQEHWGYNRFRISSGLAYDLSKRCKIGLNYIRQSQPFNPRAELDHVIQLQIQATIGKSKPKPGVKVVAQTDKNPQLVDKKP